MLKIITIAICSIVFFFTGGYLFKADGLSWGMISSLIFGAGFSIWSAIELLAWKDRANKHHAALFWS